MKYILILLVCLIGNTGFSNHSSQNIPVSHCGPWISMVDIDDNGSDINLVELTNVQTGIVYSYPHGTTSGVFPAGVYNITVHTDSQGLVKCELLSTVQCQDAYSWSGDSKAYYFNNISAYCCCNLVITIDDIEC